MILMFLRRLSCIMSAHVSPEKELLIDLCVHWICVLFCSVFKYLFWLFFQSVWGSFWKDGKWGFKCCHSCIKESYCTGAAGKEASKTSLPALTNQDQTTEQSQTSAASPVKVSTEKYNSRLSKINGENTSHRRQWCPWDDEPGTIFLYLLTCFFSQSLCYTSTHHTPINIQVTF